MSIVSRVSDKPYFLYVLWSESVRRFYTGISEDVDHRLAQHNSGVSKWTAKFGPWRLVHSEQYSRYAEARKREIQLKRQKGGAGFYKLIGRTLDQLTRAAGSSGS